MDENTNLLAETVKALQKNGKEASSVLFVNVGKISCTLDEFAEVANREYDAGFGSPEVSLSAKIVGRNWWLERVEYDGSEGWSFKSIPTQNPHGLVDSETFFKGEEYDD
jgi:hypothetical protein